MATGEDLYTFLISHGCFGGFCTAIEEQHDISFDDLIAGQRSFSPVIDTAITWDETDVGGDYWCDMNNLWLTACRTGMFYKTGLNCNNIWRMGWRETE